MSAVIGLYVNPLDQDFLASLDQDNLVEISNRILTSVTNLSFTFISGGQSVLTISIIHISDEAP